MVSSVGIQKNPLLRWGGQNAHLHDIHVPLQNASGFSENEEGFYSVDFTRSMPNSSDFRLLVRAHVVDSKGCNGKQANFTYTGKLILFTFNNNLEWLRRRYNLFHIIYTKNNVFNLICKGLTRTNLIINNSISPQLTDRNANRFYNMRRILQ